MNIKIYKEGRTFSVDPIDLPGSPILGRGRTMMEALGSFLHAYQKELHLTIVVDESAQPTEERRRKRELSKR